MDQVSKQLFLGLRTVIFPAPDLQAAKVEATTLLDIEPYFDSDFYVGYSVAGYEFALDPNADPAAGPITYWGVPDALLAVQQLLAGGASLVSDVEDVGDGIRTKTISTPSIYGRIGVIENLHFAAVWANSTGAGPGR